MNFTKKILIIFGSVTILLTIFALLTLVTLRQIDVGNDDLIEDKIHIFSQTLIAVNDAKSLEAAGAHFLIVGSETTYQRFREAHQQIRTTIQKLINDPRFEKYKDDLITIADHELKAEAAGAQAFKDRLTRKLNIEQVAQITSRDGLPHVLAIQKMLSRIESESLRNWHEASARIRDLHQRSERMLIAALSGIMVLTGLLIAALLKILQQKNHLDFKKSQLLESEQAISVARKEAVEMVAHDLRNPLSSIKMCLDILEDTPEQDRRALMQIGQKSVLNGLGLIERILDHTKIESGTMSIEKADCNLQELLNDQAVNFKNLCSSKDVIFETTIHESVNRCFCDPIRVSQVLTNLVGNALKFSEKGQHIFLSVVTKDSYLEIEIKDQGPGISAADADCIFNRYWKNSSSKLGGTGLGLAISKAIIDAHGGRIWVHSSLGKGSSFYFTLPIGNISLSTQEKL
ncbi:MAG: HAMP domain-containing histidine kinase [Bdellovibrionaceae bacterium]|nr:HAMP domain-containing histidine kinase [Pseudobdellovibrionaceae bacterium]